MTTTLGMARRSRVGVIGASTSWRVRPATGLSAVLRRDWDIGRHPFAGTGGAPTAWTLPLTMTQPCLSVPHLWAPSRAGRQSSEPSGTVTPGMLKYMVLTIKKIFNTFYVKNCYYVLNMRKLYCQSGNVTGRGPEAEKPLSASQYMSCAKMLHTLYSSPYLWQKKRVKATPEC